MTPQIAHRDESEPITVEESVRIRDRLHSLEQWPNLVEATHKRVEELDTKLHRDANGSLSWQTRLDRLEQMGRVALWISSTAATASIGQIVMRLMDAAK